MKRIASLVITLACVLCLALCLVGCGGGSEKAGGTITDAYGRTVDVPEGASKAATVGSGARFVVYAGAVDKLIAVTDMETQASPRRPYTVAYQDIFSQLPSTSNGNHLNATDVDAEALIELAPDVIISSRSAEECDKLQADTGIPVVGIKYQGELFSDDVYNSILCVGQALGTTKHAQSVVDAMKKWEKELTGFQQYVNQGSPSVFVGAVNYKGSRGLTGTYAGYPPFDLIGAYNVADASGMTAAFETSIEQIGAWDPDIMFLNPANAGLVAQDYADHKEFLDGTKAISSGNIYPQLDFNFNGTNIEFGILDAYLAASVVYPEELAKFDFEAKYKEVIDTMLGTEYYDQVKEQLSQGLGI